MALDRFTLTRRVTIEALLETATGLHVGGGTAGLGSTDDAVLRSADGRPFIPGASFKGSLRSTAERLAHACGLWSCGLIPTTGEDLQNTDDETASQGLCVGAPGEAQKRFRKRMERKTEDKVLSELETHLCDTCKLFGSPFAASKVLVDDLYPHTERFREAVEVRDGVGIDRDAGRAAAGIKYDFEVVPAGNQFKLRLIVLGPDDHDLGLLVAALREFDDGFAGLGGKRSRGLGRVELVEGSVKVTDVDLSEGAALAAYLRRDAGGGAQPVADAEAWCNNQIDALIKQAGLA